MDIQYMHRTEKIAGLYPACATTDDLFLAFIFYHTQTDSMCTVPRSVKTKRK